MPMHPGKQHGSHLRGDVIRPRQRTQTALFPHSHNKRFLVPKRVPFLTVNRLFFAGDTQIVVAAFSLDAAQESKITYACRQDSYDGTDSKAWSVGAGSEILWRLATLDVRCKRGGGAGAPIVSTVIGVVYSEIQEITAPAGTVEFILAPGLSGFAGVAAAGVDNSLQIGAGNGFTSPWIGVISDFKFFDAAGTLINHWPINDDVGDGGTIVDIVGGLDGILTLGSGFWSTPALNNAVPVSADFKTTSVVVTFDQPIINGDEVGFTVTHDGNDRAVVSAVTQGLKEIVVTHAAGSIGEAGIVTYVPGTWTGLALPNLPVEAYTESGVVS